MRSGYDFDGGVGGFLRRDPCDPCARDGRRSGRNNACPAGDRLAIARQTYDMTTRYDGVKYENERATRRILVEKIIIGNIVVFAINDDVLKI